MRIGINAVPLSRLQAGAARVIRCVIEELRQIDSENCYYLYSDRDFELPWEDDRWRKRISSPFPLLPGTLWLQTVGRQMILRDRLDLFWGTANMLPVGLPPGVAKVVTIHDLIWPIYRKAVSPFTRAMLWLFVERSARQADKVIAVSQSTARDLQSVFKVHESKIVIIHNGVSPAYKPHDSRAAAEAVANKYGVSKEYILAVGTIVPHKNLITLVKAMSILRARRELRFELLVAGEKGQKDAKLLEAIQSSGLTDNDIRFLGFVPEEDLPWLFSGSSAFVFPSLYEGFGLPLVEAMACGVPIVASNTSSIPEVVGEAALLVPATQPEAFAEAILRVRSAKDLRRAMIEKGLARAVCFRWDKAARQLLECMRNAVAEKHPNRRSMRIGIDARPLSAQPSGVHRVVKSLVEALERTDQENSYYLYSHREFDLPFENPRWHKRKGSRISILPSIIWFWVEARRAIRKDNLDVFWSAMYIPPLSFARHVATVLTVHDLEWRLYPQTMTLKTYFAHRLLVWPSVRHADRIVSVSESTARDLGRLLKMPDSKIEVIHLGVGSEYKPQDSEGAAQYVASKYSVSKDYVLAVGTVQPRKNLVALAEAMKILRDRTQHSLQLVVAGAKGWKNTSLYGTIKRLGLTGDDIHFLGVVPEEDLPVLYSGCCSFVFPSFYEGFGLPLVEAMACGVPIVASNSSSIPEVVGEAALLVPPTRPEAFAQAILRVRSDKDLRRRMIDKGLNRAASFSWDRAAHKLLECMRRVVMEKHLETRATS